MTLKAIIVGSRGQDGQLLWSQLAERGYALLGCTRMGVVGDQLAADLRSARIHDAPMVANLVDFFRPDEIYFLAAHHHSAEEGDDNPAELFRHSLDVNVLALVNFLEAVRRCSPASRLFYAASSHVFGSPAGAMQDETTPINPDSAYGISKAAGLFACRHYRRDHGIFAAAGMLYNHESTLRSERFLSCKVARGVARIKQGKEEILALGNLDAVADWGYAPDYTDAMRRILAAPAADDFIIATGKPHTVRDFARIAFESAGLDYARHVVSDPAIVRRNAGTLVGNPTHLMKTTHWQPTLDFAGMVRCLVAHELAPQGGPHQVQPLTFR